MLMGLPGEFRTRWFSFCGFLPLPPCANAKSSSGKCGWFRNSDSSFSAGGKLVICSNRLKVQIEPVWVWFIFCWGFFFKQSLVSILLLNYQMQRPRKTEATPKCEQAVTGGSAVVPENQANKQKEGLNPDRDLRTFLPKLASTDSGCC